MATVFVATFEHRHGRDISVFTTYAGAEAWRRELAAEYWEHEIGQYPNHVAGDKPEDPGEAADTYFEYVEYESFDIEECELVESLP